MEWHTLFSASVQLFAFHYVVQGFAPALISRHFRMRIAGVEIFPEVVRPYAAFCFNFQHARPVHFGEFALGFGEFDSFALHRLLAHFLFVETSVRICNSRRIKIEVAV